MILFINDIIYNLDKREVYIAAMRIKLKVSNKQPIFFMFFQSFINDTLRRINCRIDYYWLSLH